MFNEMVHSLTQGPFKKLLILKKAIRPLRNDCKVKKILAEIERCLQTSEDRGSLFNPLPQPLETGRSLLAGADLPTSPLGTFFLILSPCNPHSQA